MPQRERLENVSKVREFSSNKTTYYDQTSTPEACQNERKVYDDCDSIVRSGSCGKQFPPLFCSETLKRGNQCAVFKLAATLLQMYVF
jgi:hypothetical protein